MSQLLGASLPTTIIDRKAVRLVPSYQVIRRERDRIADRNAATEYPGGYTSSFWPGGGGLAGDQSVDVAMMSAIWRGVPARLAWGQASRIGFVGVTRDANGNRVANVTCSLFRTSDKILIDEVLSDINGDFLLSTYDSAAHFIVFAKSGAPDITGTTRQTLVGA